MEEAEIAGKVPTKVTVVAGKNYFWCSCGKSKKQPFCDGAHKGSEFSPVKFVPEEDKEVFLCMCKHSNKQPFCDGAHSKLDQE